MRSFDTSAHRPPLAVTTRGALYAKTAIVHDVVIAQAGARLVDDLINLEDAIVYGEAYASAVKYGFDEPHRSVLGASFSASFKESSHD